MIPQHQASVLILSQNYGGSFKEVYVLIGQNKLDRLHLEYFNNSSPTFWGIKWKNRHSMHYTGLNLNKFSRIRLGLIVKHYLFQYKQQWKFHLHCKADTIIKITVHPCTHRAAWQHTWSIHIGAAKQSCGFEVNMVKGKLQEPVECHNNGGARSCPEDIPSMWLQQSFITTHEWYMFWVQHGHLDTMEVHVAWCFELDKIPLAIEEL